jgi:hypothetical protein
VATASIQDPELAPTTWVCDGNEAGPFQAVGIHATVGCAATAWTSPFDPAAAVSTGDFWLPPSANTQPFQPIAIQPGQTGAFTVTLTPDVRAGTTVHGFLDIDMWNPFSRFGEELASLPYAYTAS